MIHYRDLNWYAVMDLIADSGEAPSKDYFYNEDTSEISKVELWWVERDSHFKVYINEVLMTTEALPCKTYGDVYDLITDCV